MFTYSYNFFSLTFKTVASPSYLLPFLLMLLICCYLMTVSRNIQYLFTDTFKIVKLTLLWTITVQISSINLLFRETDISIGVPLQISSWSLTFLFFFIVSANYKNLSSKLIPVFVAVLFVELLYFFGTYHYRNGMYFGYHPAERLKLLASNEIYFILLLLPWILMIKSGMKRYVLLFLIYVAVLFSFKRTAVIAISCSVFSYIGVSIFVRKKMSKLKMYVVLVLLLIAAFYTATGFNAYTNNFLYNRFTSSIDDKGSNRLEIYSATYGMITKMPLLYLFFGNGHFGVEYDSPLGTIAHNDFLEVLYDYGIFCFILYLLLHYLLIRFAISLILANSLYAAPFVSSYVLFFIISLFSHLIIFPSYFMFLTAFWGLVFGIHTNITKKVNLVSFRN